MAGSVQLSGILLKLETTSGTDAAPTNTTDAVAIRVQNLSCKIDETMATRDVIVGAFAADDQLPVYRRGSIKFSVELQASGTAGTAPAWGKALQACAFSETVTASTRVDYLPASSSLKTATIWAYYNGRLEKFVYCAGTVKLNMKVGEIPSLDFEFQGLVSSVAAGAVPALTLTSWIRCQAVGPAFTTALSVGAVTYSAGALTGGTTYNFNSLEIDLANDVQDLALVTAESVAVYGRSPKASIVADFGPTQHAQFKADMHAGTTSAFGLVHGTVAGKKVGVYAPVGVITNVEDAEQGPVIIDKVDMTLRPVASNDEFRIFCI